MIFCPLLRVKLPSSGWPGYFLLLLAVLLAAGPVSVAQTLTPPRYSYSLAPAAPLVLRLPAPLAAGLLPDSVIRIFGAQTGRRFGTWSGGGTRTLTFQPTRAFLPGEGLQLTVRGAGPAWVGELAVAPRPTPLRFQEPPLLFAPGIGVQTVVSGDWNADNQLDIAVGRALAVRVPLNPGNARFVGGDTLRANLLDPTLADALDTRAADFNADGQLDVMVNRRTFLGNGAGRFTAGGVGAQLGYHSATGDLDGDGDLDMAVGYARPGAGAVHFFFNDGTGTFTPGDSVLINIVRSNPNSLALGDLDLDGDLDLISTSFYDTHLALRFNDGTGHFTTPPRTTGGEVEVGPYPSGVAVADFDGDGDLDLAGTHNSGAGGEAVAIRFNDGTGHFDPAAGIEVVLPVPFITPLTVLAADFDGDGDPDLAIGGCPAAASTADSCAVWVTTNDGSGHFGPAQTLNARPAASSLAAGDFDGNGTLDLSASLDQAGLVATWLNPLPPPPPIPALLADLPACAGTTRTLRLRNLGGLDSVRWNFGDSTSLLQTTLRAAPTATHTWAHGGIYRVRVRWWAAPYSDTLSVRVVVLAVPPDSLLTFRRDTLLCDAFGASLTLRARPDLPAGTRLRWEPTGDTTRALLVITGGLYVLTARVGPCVSRDSVRVVEVPCGPRSLALAPAAVCLGDELILAAPATPFDSVTWRVAGQVRRGTPLRIRFATAGRRRVALRVWRWPLGPVDTGSVVVTVRAAPLPGRLLVAPLGADTLLCDSVGAAIVLRVRPDLPPGTTVRWLPTGDTTRVLRVTRPGLYQLTTVTALTCPRTQVVRVGIRTCPPAPPPPPPPPVPPPGPLPNVITPDDGNGLNDTFVVEEAGPWTLTIFTRWGREVYRSPAGGYHSDWAARGLSAGTYYYYLHRPADDKVYKGWIEVVR